MKLRILLLTLLLSCSSPEVKIEENEKDKEIDSILKRSEESFTVADSTGKETDKLINSKVEKTVKQITTLKKEVDVLKKENIVLKTIADNAVDAGKPFKLLPVSNGKDNR